MELVRYIHLNPWRAKVENKLGEYPWTSHHKYMGRVDESFAAVKEKAVLRLFSESLSASRKKYLRFVIDGMQQGHCDEFYNLRDGRILGGEEFEALTFKKMHIRHKPKMRLRLSLKKLWMKILTREALKEEPKGWMRSKLIGETAYWAIEALCLSQKDVAKYFEVHPSTINRSMYRQTQCWKNDPELKKKSEKWIQGLEKSIFTTDPLVGGGGSGSGGRGHAPAGPGIGRRNPTLSTSKPPPWP